MTDDEINAYQDGVDAGWRKGRYERVISTIECPYCSGKEAECWYEGFSDATEDFIAWQRSECLY